MDRLAHRGGPVLLSTPSGPPTRLPRAQRRVLLLGAARAAFTERGYHATAMDDIAERAGVSKPVLYQHFDSKLDLYLAITRAVAGEIVSTVETALASTDDNAARIVACLTSFFASIDQPASGYPLLFSSDLVHEPTVAGLLDDTRRACGEAIGRVLATDTELSWQECVLIGTTVAGLAQTAAQHWFDHQDELSREHAIEITTGLVWRGLGGVPARGGSAAG
jgi:AcrR family transcriptional regulator